MAKYLEQGEAIEAEQLHAPFEKALREGHLIPVCFVSAKNGAGIDELVKVFERLLPNPAEGNPPLFFKGEIIDDQAVEEFRSEPDPKKHVLAHVFKVVVDPYVGKLGIFRVHQGTVTKDTQLFIGSGRKPFKVGHLFMLQGGKTSRSTVGGAGRHCGGGQGRRDRIRLRAARLARRGPHPHAAARVPDADDGVAIAPKRRGDEQRISEVLHRMTAEDPTLVVEHDSVLNETVLRGLGELHIRSMLDRMAQQYKVEVDTRPPRIPYRETITAKAEGHHVTRSRPAARASSARSICASSRWRAAPVSSSSTRSRAASIPTTSFRRCRRASSQVLAAGPVAGFPMQDVRVTVYDGKHHPVDSKEIAFVAAGRKAFLDAIAKARPIVLEPIVNVEIEAPEGNMGDVDRRPVVAPRPDHRHACDGAWRAGRRRPGTARRTRGLLGAPQGDDAGARGLDDDALALRAGTAAPAAEARHRICRQAQAGRRGVAASTSLIRDAGSRSRPARERRDVRVVCVEARAAGSGPDRPPRRGRAPTAMARLRSARR